MIVHHAYAGCSFYVVQTIGIAVFLLIVAWEGGIRIIIGYPIDIRVVEWVKIRAAKVGDYMKGVAEAPRVPDLLEKHCLRPYINLMLSNTSDIYLIFNADARAIFANEAYRRCCNTAPQENIEGRTFNEILSPISTAEFLLSINCLYYEAIITGRTVRIDQNIDFGQAGNSRAYSVKITPMTCENGTIIGIMVVFHEKQQS